MLVGHGALLHDGCETKQREALEQVQLSRSLAADMQGGWRWLRLV